MAPLEGVVNSLSFSHVIAQEVRRRRCLEINGPNTKASDSCLWWKWGGSWLDGQSFWMSIKEQKVDCGSAEPAVCPGPGITKQEPGR